jgi:hypothetical protein
MKRGLFFVFAAALFLCGDAASAQRLKQLSGSS